MLKIILTLNQYAQNYSSAKSECASQIRFWLGVKFIGLGFNTKSNHIGFNICFCFYSLLDIESK
jgi:hypothetical protein